MKKLLSLLIVFFIMLINGYTQSIPYLPYPLFKSYNFECGGFVTAVFPAANSTGNINQQILYAKTDIGGVYRSSNNGQNWILISSYHIYDNRGTAFSEYITAGLAVHPTNPNKVIVGWGDFPEDAALTYPYPNRCLSITSDGGASWKQCNLLPSYSDGILFNGDYFPTKVGGECIIFEPTAGNNVLAGGINPYGVAPILYKSSDGGANFYQQSSTVFPADAGDTIYCIYMHKTRPEIWIGTAKGIFKSPGFNSDNSLQNFVLQAEPGGEGIRNVRRILLKGSNGMAFFAFGNNTSSANFPGGGIARYNPSAPINSQWDDLTGNFEYSGGTINTNKFNFFSLLAWADSTESILLGGRVDKQTRKSTNYGLNWIGEGNNAVNVIQFKYAPNSNFPNHQPAGEKLDGFMYGGLNFITRNQNPGCKNTWYLSGGAGLRISDNIAPTSGVFEGKKWHYSTQGQSMPVIYDIVFEGAPPNDHIYFPMADWTMGWNYHTNWNSGPLHYDDSITPGNGYFTWISNVSRHLISDNTATSYIVGGDLYSGGYFARIGKRVISGGNVTINEISFTPLMGKSERNICDGLIFDYWNKSENCPDNAYNYSTPAISDCMLFLVGGTGDDHHPYYTDKYGLYYTTDGCATFDTSHFTSASKANDGISTYQHYLDSYIPGMYWWDAWIQNMWGSQFNLAKASGNKIYLYLRNGGMFLSTDIGHHWSSVNSPPVDTCNAGCLKWSGDNSTGFLVLAIERKGLFKGTLDTNGSGNIIWASIGGFTDASQVDFDSYGSWAVFGKRSGDTYRKLYKSIFSDNNWKLVTNKLRGVRSLRINPNKREELFIATTGLGVIAFENMTNAEYPFVHDNVVINQNSYFEDNIEVESGGSLTIEGNINVNFAQGKKIYIKEGGKLNINNVTFDCIDSYEQWQGIEIENCDSSCTIQNSTFNNAALPIKIINDESYAYNEKIIKNNIFNCPDNQDFAVYAENVFNFKVEGNQFNMAEGSTNTIGLEIKNSYNVIPSESVEFPLAVIILNNTFTNGCASMILNSYASELTNFYVNGNTFNGNSVHYNIIGRMITGIIKNNNFAGTGTDNPIYFQQSNPDMFGNIINGSGTSMILNGHSYPNLSPTRTGNTYYWHGGRNRLYSVNAGNINIIDQGAPYINFGYNQFSKNTDPSYYHITGMLDSVVGVFNANFNAWCTSGSIPSNYLYTSGNPSVITDFNQNYSCNGLPSVQYSSIQITDMGFGIADTLLISINNTNYYVAPDELLYSQAVNYCTNEQYLDAINAYKSLIDNHTESQYLTTSLYEIYDSYSGLDTSSNTTYTDNLYSDLKTYLDGKIQSNIYSVEFVDIAYYLINMCEVNMQKYNDALTGFEFIAMFHPDAAIRLLASWDGDEVQQLMGQSGGENSNEVSAEKFKEKLLIKLDNAVKKDSTMGIISRIYKKNNNEIENSYSLKTSNKVLTKESKNTKDNVLVDNQNNKRAEKFSIPKEKREDMMRRAESNLRMLRGMTPDNKIKKQKEDILLIAGLTHSNKKGSENTNIPFTYNLSQNYPNPFNPVTKINYDLPKNSRVKLVIYDILGREIKTLLNNEIKTAGRYTVEFNGSNLASGVYFARILVNDGKDFMAVKKMVLVK